MFTSKWRMSSNIKLQRRDRRTAIAYLLRERARASVGVLAACGVLLCTEAMVAHAQSPLLPGTLPNRPGGAGAAWSQPNLTSGNANYDIRPGSNTGTVTLNTPRAILNWKNFDISADSQVIFNQKDNVSFVALNRVDPTGNPSVIEGRLSAKDGQIYLINQNGIVFAKGAQIDTHSLVASALDISDTVFNAGILAQGANPVFEWKGDYLGFLNSLVEVQNGAHLNSQTGGFIMLLGPRVVNDGSIATPGGQAILAAGAKVYFGTVTVNAPGYYPEMRGILVEVDPYIGTDGKAAPTPKAPDVLNDVNGVISAPRGNVTLVGMGINQDGRISATTSVNQNGIVRLLARDTVSPRDSNPIPTRTGSVEFGKNSVTEVLPELGDPNTIQDAQTFSASVVEVAGKTIQMKENSVIRAPGGIVTLSAQAGAENFNNVDLLANDSRIYLTPGSLIDVSGSQGVKVAAERNIVEVDLRGDVLADSPLQRSSVLYGKKVWVDIRKGTPFGNISGYVSGIGRTVAERTSQGGTVTLRSEGDVIQRDGSLINISGGSVDYLAGHVNNTQLVSQGRVFDIADATPDRVYDGIVGVYNLLHPKWNVTETFYGLNQKIFSPAYTEGKNAGTATFQGRNVVQNGDIKGTVTLGPMQREAGKVPVSGSVVFGNSGQYAQANPNFSTPDVLFASTKKLLPTDFAFQNTLPDTFKDSVTLAANALREGGIGRIAVYSNGKITLPQSVVLDVAPGNWHDPSASSSVAPLTNGVTLVGNQLDIQGAINAPGGAIQLESVGVKGNPVASGLVLGSASKLTARGAWVNDAPTATTLPGTDPLLINGGSATLSSERELKLALGSVVDVSAGGRIDAKGKFRAGKGGDINLKTGLSDKLTLEGELRGFALSTGPISGNGGTLTIDTSNVRIGAARASSDLRNARELLLAPGFFQSGGFKKYQITGQNALTVASGSVIEPKVANKVLAAGFTARRSGQDSDTFSVTRILPPEQRSAASIQLATKRLQLGIDVGNLTVEKDAAIRVDPTGEIALSSTRQLTVLGELNAPAGKINLSINGPGDSDPFIANQSIWIGDSARLLSGGYAKTQVNNAGLTHGEILSGGNVTINAGKGYVFTQTGSLIDVSGVGPTLLDIPQQQGNEIKYAATQVAGDAGSIGITTREGGVLNGMLRAVPGDANAAGGALALTLSRLAVSNPGYPSGPVSMVVQSAGQSLPPNLNPGDAIDPAIYNGKLFTATQPFQDGGFDRLALKSGDNIQFRGDINLTQRRSLTLDAPNLVSEAYGAVQLSAAYISLGNSDPIRQSAVVVPSSGAGTLAAHARLIDLEGNSALQNFKQVKLESSGDIRLKGVLNATNLALQGKLLSAGDLTLKSVQIYPTTFSQFTLASAATDGTVSIQQWAPHQDSPVLSAAGTLTIQAPNIDQQGVLKAPFGGIVLDADNLTLSKDSVTSVSAEGMTIPFGRTQLSGRDYVYALDNQTKSILANPPEKNVKLNAGNVNMEKGAVINLSGGGDLYAYEFTAGRGGSKDVLDPANAPGSYAILPWLKSDVPYDHQEYLSGSKPNLNSGDKVYLSAVDGLAAGFYSLLPARYALLDGAYLVTPIAGHADMPPRQTSKQLDGTTIVAGYHASVGFDGSLIRDARTSGFAVSPGSAARARSEYLDTRASQFFATNTALQMPADAGRLTLDIKNVLSGINSLKLDGTLLTAHSDAGRGAEVDISAPKLAVGAGESAQFVQLDPDSLNRLGASSLLLGGTRKGTKDGVGVTVGANQVTINGGVKLTAPELILAANDTLTVRSGAKLAGKGTFSGTPKNITINGNGALLRVSSGKQATVTRPGSDGSVGDLLVETGASLYAEKSMIVDATHDTSIGAGTVTFGEKGEFSVGARRISLGEVGTVSDGLAFSNTDLAQFNTLEQLSLTSYSTVDLLGNVVFGNAALNLNIQSAGIRGFQGTQKHASITANNFSLSNTSGSEFISAGAALGSGNGNLTGNAKRIVLGSGKEITDATGVKQARGVTIEGFDQVTLASSGEITAAGMGRLDVNGGNLALLAPRLAGAAGSDQSITSSGAFSLATTAAPATLDPVTALGGRLNIRGSSITLDSEIDVLAGAFTASATTGNVTLGSQAKINANGVAKQFVDTVAYAPGGSVAFTSERGNVVLNAAAVVDVSGADGGNAGSLAINAALGESTLDGTLKGYANADAQGNLPQQGRFSLDVAKLASFSVLNDKLAAKLDSTGKAVAGGFGEEIDVHVRTGNVALASTDTVKAHQVKVAADGGKLDVAGKIDARGAKGGEISLYASGNLTLAGATLDASATESGTGTAGTAGRGGKVTLGVANPDSLIDVQSNVNTNVGGKGTGRDGSVLLRAPRIDSNGDGLDDDVGIKAIAGTIIGAREVVVEAVKVYDAKSQGADITSIGNGSGSGILNIAALTKDTADFMARAVSKTPLSASAAKNFHLRPGVEVRAKGDLTLTNDWNLLALRYGSEPGALSLRAGGNLNLSNSLSDGFSKATALGRLQNGNSWSYRLIAGADLAAAAPLALKPLAQLGSKGDVTIDKIVRTGTGDIAISAARNIVLSKAQSVIYTAGRPAESVSDFTNYGSPVGTAIFYPKEGGDITLRAQGDINGALTPQLISDWLYRRGQTKDGTLISKLNPTWVIEFAKFEENIGALGGGDVSVVAGGNIHDLSAVIPTTGRLSGKVGAPALESNLHVLGGGDLSVRAGKDISGGVFYVADGKGTINAGGSLVAAREVPDTQETLHTILALGNGTFQVQTGKNLDLETVLNPTFLTQSFTNGISSLKSYFFTYGPDSSVALNAIGDIRLFNNQTEIAKAAPQLFDLEKNKTRGIDALEDQKAFTIYPPTLWAAALQGNVTLDKDFILFPSATGNLDLLAGNSVVIKTVVTMSDGDPRHWPQPTSPTPSLGYVTSSNRSSPPLHLEDKTPIRIAALTGDIIGDGATLNLPKPALISAGRDIKDLNLVGQNLRNDNVTALSAGRDIVFTTPRDGFGNPTTTSNGFTLGGPGVLALTAGRNVDLGSSNGVVTRGNIDNPALPANGASITVMAGAAGADYAKFVERYFSANEQSKVVDYVRQWLNNPLLTPAQALAALNDAAPTSAKQDMTPAALYFASQAKQKLYEALKQAGVEHNQQKAGAAAAPGTGYERGYQAIATLFPGGSYQGDLNLFFSQLKTEQGGDIQIGVPGGLVNAGLANPGGFAKSASNLGIVTVGGGSVNAFVNNDFLVNQSRVFTLGGGDILIWSSQGNIDAGKGAKTASATPPPKIQITSDGKVTVDISNSVAGSGIGVLLAKEGISAGEVNLIAPKGEVNAGDAGIRAAGNINIAALRVVGAENIQVGGAAVGVPSANTSSLASGLTGVSGLSDAGKGMEDASKSLADKAKEAEKAMADVKKALSDFKPSLLTVEVIGLGE